MRERSEVIDRFRELGERYLRERKDRYLSRIPINCCHNIRLRSKGKGQLGFCQNPLVLSKCGNHGMFLCNDEDTAKRCRVFSCKHTEASVERDFREVLSSPSRCGNEYPKLAMLIWFLQEIEVRRRSDRLAGSIISVAKSVWGLISFRWW